MIPLAIDMLFYLHRAHYRKERNLIYFNNNEKSKQKKHNTFNGMCNVNKCIYRTYDMFLGTFLTSIHYSYQFNPLNTRLKACDTLSMLMRLSAAFQTERLI